MVVRGPNSSGAPFSFTLRVVAVDLAGNESAAQTVLVQDPGVQDDAGGCRVAGDPGPATPAIVFVLAALIAAAHQRRRAVWQRRRRW